MNDQSNRVSGEARDVVANLGFLKAADAPAAPTDYHVGGYDGATFTPLQTRIRDARPLAGSLSLGREGFALVSHSPACGDTEDEDVLKQSYIPELAEFVKDYVGADHILPFRGRVFVRYSNLTGTRLGTAPGADYADVKIPVHFTHTDYSPDTAHLKLAEELALQGISAPPHSRYMFVQTWRALSAPPQDSPLALCDGSSVAASDITIGYGRAQGQYYSEDGSVDVSKAPARFMAGMLSWNPNQRWYYFSDLTPNEVILFNGYDSAQGQKSPRVAHSAFDNRANEPRATQRRSVDTRFIAFFD